MKWWMGRGVFAHAPVGGWCPPSSVWGSVVAHSVVGLIVADGASLKNALRGVGIYVCEPYSDSSALHCSCRRWAFIHHTAVIAGHMASQYWPCIRRGAVDSGVVRVCACGEFGMRAECGHAVFVWALRKDPRVNLTSLPHARSGAGLPRGTTRASH